MMAFVLRDRVHETTTTTGTGPLALLGAVSGFQTFGAVCNVGDTCWYAIVQGGGSWETGLGTYSAANQLTRTTIFESSTGAVVSFGAGTKDVFIGEPASKAMPNIQGYLFGLTLSTAGASSTFGIAAGSAADSTALRVMALPSAFTKTSAAWAVGTGNGSFDGTGTGPSTNTNTWFHVYLIMRTDTGVVDILTSLSATAPTLPTSYTIFRRIGSMLTNSTPNWTKFTQLGDEFLWDSSVQDGNSVTLSTTATLATLSVPLGVQVLADVSFVGNPGAAIEFIVSSPDSADLLPTASLFSALSLTGAPGDWHGYVRTDTSSRVRFRASASATGCFWNTRGWIDQRGKLV